MAVGHDKDALVKLVLDQVQLKTGYMPASAIYQSLKDALKRMSTGNLFTLYRTIE